jgi:hypothetical protein
MAAVSHQPSAFSTGHLQSRTVEITLTQPGLLIVHPTAVSHEPLTADC